MRAVTFAAILAFCFALPARSQVELGRFIVSKDIEVIRVSKHVLVHVSNADVPGFGVVASNGAIFVDGGEALLFDTPMNDSLTARLVGWISDSLHVKIVGFVPNHWHNDCLGGLNFLHKVGIASYANEMTIAIAKARGIPVPQHGFADSLHLRVGNEVVVCRYFGPAHAKDNIVVWMPSDSVLFAGCMAKDVHSKTLGNLSDADLAGWPTTIARVTEAFPQAKVVVPGHGASGGRELLVHTLELLQKK
jgi:metallo-beta-lactamase class B